MACEARRQPWAKKRALAIVVIALIVGITAAIIVRSGMPMYLAFAYSGGAVGLVLLFAALIVNAIRYPKPTQGEAAAGINLEALARAGDLATHKYSVPEEITVTDLLAKLHLNSEQTVVIVDGTRVIGTDAIRAGANVTILPRIAGGKK
ncbi:MAG TPA: MoaD/ThiS family protein [Candidatus Lokiarchaeia archaeon]|nr:MoaD/ThiS family protein [Candidatus Lokiarchaeia archaeon]